MLCTEEMGTLLSRYVDGELADKERKSLEAHLETCASCRDVLNLFQRNDNVLNNALVGEAFGAQTVDAVMTEIRRLEEPMVVAPAVDEEPAAPVAMRQVIQVTRMWPFAAAAALMIACVGAVLAFTHHAGKEREALALRVDARIQRILEDKDSERVAFSALADRLREVSEEIVALEMQIKLLSTPESTGIAFTSDRSIVVQAHFSLDKFVSFEVFRCREIGNGRYDQWVTIAKGLPTPQFRDTDVEEGVNYMYQVRAFYRKPVTKSAEDSVPVVHMLPLSGGLDPKRSLKVRFIGALPDNSQATFQVSRYDKDRLVTWYYNVKPGGRIGDAQVVDGKEMDFSTGYTLSSISIVHEVIGIGPTPLTRQTRQANLRAEAKTGVQSLSVPLERFQYIPLPK